MTEFAAPQTPEEAAALRALAAKRRRQLRCFALCWSVAVSAHATMILHTLWQDWPLDARDLGRLAFFVANALVGGLGMLAWSLSGLREHQATARRWTLEDVRWGARDRAWRERRAGPAGPRRDGEAR